LRRFGYHRSKVEGNKIANARWTEGSEQQGFLADIQCVGTGFDNYNIWHCPIGVEKKKIHIAGMIQPNIYALQNIFANLNSNPHK